MMKLLTNIRLLKLLHVQFLTDCREHLNISKSKEKS